MVAHGSLVVSLLFGVCLASPLLAHGGSYVPPPPPPPPGGHYTGPGDTAPPATGGPHGPTTGAPTGPSAPAPAAPSSPRGPSGPGTTGPSTGGSGGPSAGPPTGGMPGARPGATTPRGLAIEVDTGTWDYWWEYNKHRFLRLREARDVDAPQTGSDDFFLGATRRGEARDTLRPTDEHLITVVLPALKHALDATSNRDIATACLIAMAKVGHDHPDFTLYDAFVPRLRAAEQEVRETAALAFGVAGRDDDRTLGLLDGLVLDDAVGRAARGAEVEVRVRSFAAYALGLLAHRSSRLATKARVAAALGAVVADPRLRDRNLRIAAITGLGLIAPDPADYASVRLADEVLSTLGALYVAECGAGDHVVLAHCPTAIARLTGCDHPRSNAFRRLFVAHLGSEARTRAGGHLLAQSCALALGQMATPNDGADSLDADCSEALLAAARGHVDESTRNFAVIALAQIGGTANRAALLAEFARGGRATRRPWCALALGVCAFQRRSGAGDDAPDAAIEQLLAEALQQAKEPGLVGALGVALGLARGTSAAPELRERMLAGVAKEQMAGYLGIGLALMDDAAACADLQQLIRVADRRPRLMVQAATALGRLGDRRVADELVERLRGGEPNLIRLASLSAALGVIGDRRSIPALLDVLHDQSLGNLPRAFAAAALGGIADPRALPWNLPIAANVNYRANCETLTDQVAGVLDLL